jgi:hypothetical protein
VTLQDLAELMFNVALAVVAVITCSGGDPLKEPHKVPMCAVTCDIFNGQVTCTGITVDVWSDFLAREVKKSEHNYCGACGTPRPCKEN